MQSAIVRNWDYAFVLKKSVEVTYLFYWKMPLGLFLILEGYA